MWLNSRQTEARDWIEVGHSHRGRPEFPQVSSMRFTCPICENLSICVQFQTNMVAKLHYPQWYMKAFMRFFYCLFLMIIMIILREEGRRWGKRQKHIIYIIQIYYGDQVIILEIAYHIACEGINGTFRGTNWWTILVCCCSTVLLSEWPDLLVTLWNKKDLLTVSPESEL